MTFNPYLNTSVVIFAFLFLITLKVREVHNAARVGYLVARYPSDQGHLWQWRTGEETIRTGYIECIRYWCDVVLVSVYLRHSTQFSYSINFIVIHSITWSIKFVLKCVILFNKLDLSLTKQWRIYLFSFFLQNLSLTKQWRIHLLIFLISESVKIRLR